MSESKPSFWSTLPGILTALGGFVGAVAALLTALYTMGLIGPARSPSANNSAGGQASTASLSNQSPSQPDKQSAPESTSAVDRTDAASTARAVLKAYKSRDLVSLAKLSTSFNRQLFAEIVEQGENHPRYSSVFSGSRWQAVQAWDGKVSDVRYRASRARVKFGMFGPDEVAVVTLLWVDGVWSFDDIHSPDLSSFESDSATR